MLICCFWVLFIVWFVCGFVGLEVRVIVLLILDLSDLLLLLCYFGVVLLLSLTCFGFFDCGFTLFASVLDF